MSAVVIPTASRAEWLEARRGGITASEIAVVLGLSPYDSPYGLYHRKLGILPEQEESDAMQLGKHMESFVARKFADLHPEYTVIGDGETLFAHPDRRWQMATTDRDVYEVSGMADRLRRRDPLAVLECKIDGGSDEWGEDGTDEVPVYYRAQVLWQCDVRGTDHWYLACLDWFRRKVRVYEGFIDDAARADLKLMREEARDFLDRIDAKEPPDVDWRPATLAALKTLHPGAEDRDAHVGRQLEISYRAAVRKFKAAERRKDEMTARMLAAMGDARRAVAASTVDENGDRIVIATRSVSHPKRIDTDKLRAEHPAIAAACTKPPKPEVKLTPAKPKKDSHVSPDHQ